MAWVITRRATDEDRELLAKRAAAFMKRHEIKVEDDWGPVAGLEFYLDYQSKSDEVMRLEAKRLWALWRRIANRAIGDDGIDRGYVGHYWKD